MKQYNTTICNSFLDENFEKVGICLSNLLTEFSDAKCIYKKIPFRNYFIRISEYYLYAFIVTPIKILKNCRGKNDIMHLNDSVRIFVPNGCEVFKYTDKFHYKGEKNTQVDITPQDVHLFVNLSLPEVNKQLSLLPLWDKYRLLFIESLEKIERIKKSIPLQREKINEIKAVNGTTLSDFLPDFGFKKFFTNLAIQILLLILAIIILLILIKKLIIKCLIKNWKK